MLLTMPLPNQVVPEILGARIQLLQDHVPLLAILYNHYLPSNNNLLHA